MTALIAETVKLIALHAEWTFPVMFLIAFGESFVFLSLLFPGTAIMIAAGLLVPNGTIPLVPLLCGAISGAVVGDGISWWLGRRYGHHLTARWPFTSHPQLLAGGENLFRRLGTASVFIGRFLGPFRATIPLVAGIMKMRAGPFWFANIASALIWAPALLLPGSLVLWVAEASHLSKDWKIIIGAGVLLIIAALVWMVRKFELFWLRSD